MADLNEHPEQTPSNVVFCCPYCNAILSYDVACTFNWYKCYICNGIIDMYIKPMFIGANNERKNIHNFKT